MEKKEENNYNNKHEKVENKQQNQGSRKHIYRLVITKNRDGMNIDRGL